MSNHLEGTITRGGPKIEGTVQRKGPNIEGTMYRATHIYEYDYNELINKPQIESVELVGNKELEDIGVDHLAIEDLIHILN